MEYAPELQQAPVRSDSQGSAHSEKSPLASFEDDTPGEPVRKNRKVGRTLMLSHGAGNFNQLHCRSVISF
jgi:hypothetical protein